MTRKLNNRGFTLVEMMIVVGVIAILAAIAIPSFLKARERSISTQFISTTRVFSEAVVMFAADFGQYPEDSDSGVMPANFDVYIRETDWYKGPTIGGVWDHELNESDIVSAIGCDAYEISDEQVLAIDEMADDGDTTTGNLRIIANGRYYSVIAE